jgi:CO/xanthine dehydrogenase Mo-binding subunit
MKLPGVLAIVTGEDMPLAPSKVVDLAEGAEDLRFNSDKVMAQDKVLFKGHPVAAVAAVDPNTAAEALAHVEVEYEVLEPILDVHRAMAKDAPTLLKDLVGNHLGHKVKNTNVASHNRHEFGDVDAAFKTASLVVERDYSLATVHQGYIEPQNATAYWSPEDRITVWTSTQGAHGARRQLAGVLRMPESHIKVVPLEIGGGFGGKINAYLPPVAALLSRKAGRPVKLVMTRAEVFEGTGPAPGTYSKVKIGVTRDGRITAAQATLIYEVGAFPRAQVSAGATCIFSPYRIENVLIDGYDVMVNKPKCAAYRAPGSPMACFAAESVIDEICEKLELDPLEFRLLNSAREGDRRADGVRHPKVGFVETVQAAQRHPHYSAPLKGPHRGRGVASGYWVNGSSMASCLITVNPDGTVSLLEGSPDIGGTRTAVAMQAAEVLGIPAEDVHPTVVDTDSIGFTGLTAGSSTAFKTGWAAYEAAQDLVRRLRERVAKIWGVVLDEVEFSQGTFRSKTNPDRLISFKVLTGKLNSTGGPITGSGNVNPSGVGPALATHIVDVEVDPETGKVQILRYTACQDVGKAVHPSYVEGQLQGGVAQGVGWALSEEYFFDDQGRMANASFLDYRMPTSLDLPMIETVLVEVPNPGHPFGVRGVGEVSIVPPMAAIANAIHRAVGLRMTSLPVTPAKLLQALWAQPRGNGKG